MFLAKLKGKTGQHQILMNDNNELNSINFYKAPNIIEAVLYDPERKRQQNEWYYVELTDDQKQEMISPYLSKAESSADLNRSTKDDYQNIESVYRILDPDIIFTRITDGYKIENKMFLNFHDTGHATLETQKCAIAFNGVPDAYFDGDRRLYFRDFSKIRVLFDGIEVFFREATRSEKEAFLKKDLFDVDQNLTPDIIGQRASLQIAAILNDNSINLDDQESHEKIFSSIDKYPEASVVLSDLGKIYIRDNKELTRVLNLLSSRYYTSDITGKKMESYGSVTLSEESGS